MSRFLFVGLLFAFGAFMFLAGLRAPSQIREPIAAAADRAAHTAQQKLATVVHWASGSEGDPPLAVATIPYKRLMLSTAALAGGAYGVQVGLYSDDGSARRGAATMDKQGRPTSVIAVGSGAVAESYVLALGPLATLSDAHGLVEALRFNLPAGMVPVTIVWPVPGAKKTQAAGSAHASTSPSTPASNPGRQRP